MDVLGSIIDAFRAFVQCESGAGRRNLMDVGLVGWGVIMQCL